MFAISWWLGEETAGFGRPLASKLHPNQPSFLLCGESSHLAGQIQKAELELTRGREEIVKLCRYEYGRVRVERTEQH